MRGLGRGGDGGRGGEGVRKEAEGMGMEEKGGDSGREGKRAPLKCF